MDYFLHIAIIVAIYVMLAVSLNLVAGFAGLLSVAHAAFYGVGAYTAALLTVRCGSPFLLSVCAAAAAGAAAGTLIGIPSLRIRGDYFVIATFAFQVIVVAILRNWVEMTGGAMGLPGIPAPSIAGWTANTRPEVFALAACAAAVATALCALVGTSPFGRVLRAIREDEILAESVGKAVARSKLLAFVFSAAVAGAAGAVYAHYIRFIDPSTFDLAESIFLITVVIIGGAGDVWGPVLGAALLVTLPELLRFLGIPDPLQANVRQMLYGGLLLLFVMWRPQGLLGGHEIRG